jgi:peptide deformylase
MNDVLTIDTSDSIKPTIYKEEKLDPLPLYGEDFSMLEDEIPLYKESLPNYEMSKLVKRLKMTMKLYGGVGLSANQCGVYERVFVIGTDQFQIVCINPEVLETSQEETKDNEGCLSFPGLYLKIPRSNSIKVRFMDENGDSKEMWLDGLTARCYLHELDHMNGIKFTNKVGPVSIQMARKKQQKIMKTILRKRKNDL